MKIYIQQEKDTKRVMYSSNFVRYAYSRSAIVDESLLRAYSGCYGAGCMSVIGTWIFLT